MTTRPRAIDKLFLAVAAARAAGIPVVCVSYGYNHGEDIGAACPDAVIDSLEDLPAMLAESAAEPR